jgi:hypothetical protein
MTRDNTIPLLSDNFLRAITGEAVGFTGSRLDRPEAGEHICEVIETLGERCAAFVTAACVGMDERIGMAAAIQWPEHHHIIIVPADRSRVCAWWRSPMFRHLPHLEVIEMPPHTKYAHRNQRVVSATKGLVGYPEYAENDTRSKRSGSWQTIRMARAQHSVRPVAFPLEAL